ncbi:MAG TPA: hypothetical protein VNS55_10675 [Nocardioides sp.]|nr:hypothetical protein [Nocardioides sp.]
MFARSSTYRGDPTALDAGIAFVRDDVLPTIDSIHGCVGLSLMVDRESGDCIVTTAWRTAETMKQSEEEMSSPRARLGEILGGDARVEEWEIAAMHRDHATPEGSCCRVTWLRTNHADVDRGITLYRTGVLPRLEEIDGFCSASLMVNRELGRACSTVSYESRAALEGSRDEAWAIRDAGVREAGVDVLDATELELVLAHLRVPSLAGGA